MIEIPEEVNQITSMSAELINYSYLLRACYAWVNWKITCGLPAEQFLQRPEQFVSEMDLERLVNVVSNWPRRANMRPPTLPMLIQDLHTVPPAQPVTFLQRLLMFEEKILSWMVQNKIDPAHPNESREDKAKRDNARRQKEWRQRKAQPRTGEPEESTLVTAVRGAATELTKARAWAREEEKAAKVARDIAIAQAREACGKHIQWIKGWVDKAEESLLDAELALREYKSN